MMFQRSRATRPLSSSSGYGVNQQGRPSKTSTASHGTYGGDVSQTSSGVGPATSVIEEEESVGGR